MINLFKVLESLGSPQFLSRQDIVQVPLSKCILMFTGDANIYIMICVQIKLLFQTGFDEAELRSYISVIHANVYQTIKVRNN